MNLILVEPRDFANDGRVVLTDRRLRHARKVLRAEPGDALRVGLLGGALGRGIVLSIDREAIALEVELGEPPPPPSPLALVLALPRPPQLRRILQGATALGIKRIALVDSARVEKSFWQSHAVSPASLDEQVRLGLEQAGDTKPPCVALHRDFARFVEDGLPDFPRPVRVAHPDPNAPAARPTEGPSTLVIGPEGGWLDAELERLAGERIRLGRRILRVEHAVIALAARLAPESD